MRGCRFTIHFVRVVCVRVLGIKAFEKRQWAFATMRKSRETRSKRGTRRDREKIKRTSYLGWQNNPDDSHLDKHPKHETSGG